MSGHKIRKQTLRNTTALVAVALLAMPVAAGVAQAAPVGHTMTNGENYNNPGSVTGSSTGVLASGLSSGSITNSGSISGGIHGIYVSNGTIDSVTNESGGSISANNSGGILCC